MPFLFKRIKFIYYYIFVLTLIFIVILWNNIHWILSSNSQLDLIKARGELRISTINAPPSYISDNGIESGFDYELAKMFSNYLGVRLKIEPANDINQMFSNLENNKIDILAAALTYNPDRMKQFNVGPAYYTVSQQLIYNKNGKKPRSLEQLDKEIIVSNGSAQASILFFLQKTKYPNLNWSSSKLSSRDLLRQLADGTISYTIADSVTVAALQRAYPQLTVAFDISEEEPVMWYISASEDNSLYAALLDFFSKISDDSTLARLEEKYLGHMADEFNYVDFRTFLTAIEKILPDYKALFQQYATNDLDWRILAAVAYQESHWDPLATSTTGVRGLMMLTRTTAESFGISNRLDPEQSIKGGVIYLNYLLDRLPKTIPKSDRIWFALMAYNMGFTHMMDARILTQMQQGNPDSWLDVKKRLPLLTQQNYYKLVPNGYAKGYQAARYIENIRRYKLNLDTWLQESARREKDIEQEQRQRTILGNYYPAVKFSQSQ